MTRGRKLRIFHGPRNVAGIGGYIADWQRSKGAISDFVVLWQDQTHRQNHHIRLDLGSQRRIKRWYLRFVYFLFAAIQYDLFHFYGETTLLGRNADLPILKWLGKKVLITYCGSDIRQAEVLNRLNPYFKLVTTNVQDRPERDAEKRRTLRRHARWADRIIVGRALYYSAKDFVPPAKLISHVWIHTTVDLSEIEIVERKTRKLPVVVHAPSNRGIKGTEYIEHAINRLHQRGLEFRFLCVEKTPHREMMRILRDEADIVVDQVLYGDFGSLAVEAMAHQLTVCCYMIEEVKSELYPDIPIVNVTIDTLEEKLACLINNPEERHRLGCEGRAFVERYCQRNSVNEEIWSLYEEVLST